MAQDPAQIPDSWLLPGFCHRTFVAGPTALSCGVVAKRGTGWDWRGRPADHYSVVWCLRGRGRYHDDSGRVWDLAPGDLFHRFSDRPHSNELDPTGAWVEAYIGFGGPLGEALVAMRVIDPAQPVRRIGIDLILLRSIMQERDALREAADRELPVHLGRLVALHQDLLARADHHAGSQPHEAAIDRACRRLADEPHVQLRALAHDCGLSYERFRKVFRERLGVSPHDYRIRRRIDQACMALRSDERPVQEIAAALGYANPFQFSAQFKRLVGVSPAAYRQRR
jgi:AraC family transcriptional regulator, arabinose operon regulatory protein